MKTVFQAISMVFYEKKNIPLGFIAAAIFGVVFVVSSGIVTFFPEGPFIEFNLLRLTTLLALVVLSGLVVPMQVFAIQKANAGLKGSSSSLGGLFVGIATMSCCAPLLLPAILAFVGFSGTQILFFNTAIRQYVLPLSFLSVGLLFLSLIMVSRSVVAACKINLRRIQ